jgi:hypothetical protein
MGRDGTVCALVNFNLFARFGPALSDYSAVLKEFYYYYYH